MDLKNRLDALRRQAGATPAAPVPGPDGEPSVDAAAPDPNESAAAAYREDLRARLRRLVGRADGASAMGSGAAVGTAVGVPAVPDTSVRASGPSRRGAPVPAAALADRLGGQVVTEHLLLVETVLPLRTTHGRWPLADALGSLWPLVIPAPLPGEGPGRGQGGSVLGIDTETTGLAGGTGTAAFMVGIAEARPEGVRLRQWLLTAFAGEAAMLAELEAALAGAGLMVSYNGKTFDLPLLRDRRRLQRAAALPEPPHLDLLHPTRRLFRGAWPDCRLATAERQLLGLVRDDDLPGSEAPRAWRDYLAGGSPDGLGRVLRHNALDVLSLLLLGPMLARALREPAAFGADPLAVAETWRRCGRRDRSLAVLEGAGAGLDTRGLLELARELRRMGRLPEAVAIWDRLAQAGCPDALEHLAKYHEHVRRDWRQALDYANRLDDRPEARRRRSRIERRLASGQHCLDF